MRRRALGLLALGVVALVAALAWRTHGLAAATVPGAGVKLAVPPAIDRARASEHLAMAIRIQTISRREGVLDSPQAFVELRAWLAATYPKLHAALPLELVDGNSLFYTWKGSDPTLAPILLLAHQDVVPVEEGTEGGWDAPPFSGAIEDGYVYGRGAMDDKGSLIATFEAVEALLGAGFAPKRTILLAFGHDEETKGHGAAAIAALLKSRGVHAWFALDEGMSIVQDFPLTHGPVTLIGVTEKGYLTVRVTARGQGGHSSMPPKDTAAERLSRAILALRAHPFAHGFGGGPAGAMLEALAPGLGLGQRVAIANRWAFEWLLARVTGATPTGEAMLGTSIAPTMIDGGAKENVLPQEMHAIVNLRLHPRDSVDSALAHLRAAIAGIDDVSIELQGSAIEPSPVSSTTSDAYGLVPAAARDNAPSGAPTAPMLVLGATDSRHYVGVATDVYRFEPVWIALADRTRVHGTNERLSIDNLERMARFYAELVATGGR